MKITINRERLSRPDRSQVRNLEVLFGAFLLLRTAMTALRLPFPERDLLACFPFFRDLESTFTSSSENSKSTQDPAGRRACQGHIFLGVGEGYETGLEL